MSKKDHDPLLKLAFLVSVSQIKGVSGVTARVSIILTNAFNFRKDKCWWSVSKLAKVVQASERQVKSAIKVFKEHHIFKIASGRTGKANEYKPNFNIIMQYPALASEKTLQKVRQFNAPQTINTNYKTNTTAGSKSKGWGKKLVESSYPIDRERNLKDYVGFVQRGQHTTWLSDDMVKQMYDEDLITEEVYKKW